MIEGHHRSHKRQAEVRFNFCLKPVRTRFNFGVMMENRHILFAPFRLDPVNRQLFCDGREIELRPKAFAVLQYLAERAGQLVTKEDLLKAIWPDVKVIDTALKCCIGEIREVLGDDQASPRFIKTKRGAGYMFVAAVSVQSLPNLRIASFHDLWASGLSTEDVLKTLIEIDYENLQGLDEISEGTHDQWVQVASNNPDGYAFLMADNRIVGYWHFEAIDERSERELMDGTFEDSDLRVDRIRFLCQPDSYIVYFIIYAIRRPYRGFRANRMLYNAFLDRVTELRSNGIVITRVLANAFTPEGVALCRSVGMKEIKPHSRSGLIFEARMEENRHLKEGTR